MICENFRSKCYVLFKIHVLKYSLFILERPKSNEPKMEFVLRFSGKIFISFVNLLCLIRTIERERERERERDDIR